jgi:hypothetical protein
MAYADGELDEPLATALEQAIADDPAIARRVVDFVRSRRLTRSALSQQGIPDIPSELRAAILERIEEFKEAEGRAQMKHAWPHEQSLTQRSTWITPTRALAATAAAIGIAIIGYFAGQQNSWPTRSTSLLTQLEAPTIQELLSSVPSGQDVVLPLGRLRVISTYRLASGVLCREFHLQANSDATTAVACHDSGWRARLALQDSRTDAVYAPSSGSGLIAAYLQEIGANEPLEDAVEVEALTRTKR